MESPPDRTKFRRKPDRGSHSRVVIDSILDEAMVAHLGLLDGERPLVIPTLHARVGDLVYFHGSEKSQTAQALAAGAQVCLTVSLIDGLVLAGSAFKHSVNYRSAVLFGVASEVEGEEEKLAAMRGFVEQLVPGRWADIRPPSAVELGATTVLALPIDAASAKVRSGPPGEEANSPAPTPWTGVLPLRIEPHPPVPAPKTPPEMAIPDYIQQYRRPG